MKKLISLTLALMLALTLFPSALAEGQDTSRKTTAQWVT